MRKSQMEGFRKKLLEQKQAVLTKVESFSKSTKEVSMDEVRDSADIASDYYERELAMGLSETERMRLQEVEEALERIDNGTYGKCEACGNLIAGPRLEALPFAKFCVDCKAKQEQNKSTLV